MAIVSKSEFARRKGISPAMVTKLCRSGRIPVLKSGKLDFDKASAAYEASRQVGREVSAENGKRGHGISSEQPELPADDAGLAGVLPVLRCNSTRLRPQKKFIRQS